MDDLLNEFLQETNESIDVVDNELVKLEQDPNNKGVLDNIFRLVHTIKGTCGFLGLPRLESVAHSAENVLGKFRDGELEVTPDYITVILESLDRIKEIMAGLEETEQEPDGDDSELIERLDAIFEGRDAAAPSPAAAPVEEEAAAAEAGADDVDQTLGRALKPGEVSLEELEAAFNSAPGPEEESAPAAAQTPAEASEWSTDSDETLYSRLGGDDTLSVVAHLLANRVAKDRKLSAFFQHVPEDHRKKQFSGLLTAVCKEHEDAAENVAKVLVNKAGFEDEQMDQLLLLLRQALTEVQAAEEDRDDACMAFELMRGPIKDASAAHAAEVAQEAAAQSKAKSSQAIRVSVDLLEDLMNMVSELVLTRNQLLQMVRNTDDSEFAVPIQRLSQTTSELQEGVMKTRMQPIGNAWSKLPRIIRDLSVDLDKKIELDMIGEDTELDRQVLELIKDPLTHMVRNSCDHGIETPAERVAHGKAEHGTVRLNAYHEGGHIIVEISDDGRGIAVEKLRSKALEKGLASEGELADMSDAQIQKFIFHPGFSTAAAVTNVSGRGVGMDVVRSNIEKIGGTIDMNSIEGKGTTFYIKIPLTLAIVSAMIVQASEERFAIPQISVLELVRVSTNDNDHKIERIKDTPVLRLRNRLLPLVYLNEILGFKSRTDIDEREDSDDFIVVTQVGAFTFGIVVDQVFDTEEIVVKPVAPILKELSVYSGNTILGDGSVIMILDPNGVATMANSSAGSADDTDSLAAADVEKEVVDTDRDTMLIFRGGDGGQKAVPLSLVARLEDIEISEIEESDGRKVVQYRGDLMPLVLVEGSDGLREDGRQPVLVFTDDEHTMGLAVDEIVDIIEDKMDIKLASDRAGMVGSAIVDGKATEIIDVTYYLERAFGDWLKSRDTLDDRAPQKDTSVLLIDDSAFFRNMLKPLLTVAGYQVTTVDSASEALELRESGSLFDLIISDIEMPGMDGFELAQIIKSGGLWQGTPMVALSGLASQNSLDKGRDAGFNDYVAKFDRDALLQSLAQQLKIKGAAA